MSNAVAEANSQVPTTSARPKAGQGNQSSSGDAFSGMVDDNLAATDTGETSSTERSQRSARTEGTEQQPPRTGIRRSQGQTNSARQSSTEPAANDSRLADANASEETNATPALQVVVSTGIVTANTAPEQVGTTSDGESDDASAPAEAPVTVTTGIVAAAVAVQIELASEAPASVIDSGDALTISNPPATIVAAPAETAANALARVALDTGETQAPAVAETDAQAQTETDVVTSPANEATPAATTDANTTDVAANTDAAIETAVRIDTVAADVQLEAKATAELSAAAKAVDPSKPVAEPKPDQIIASTEAKPAQARTDARAAAEPPPPPKPEPQNDRRVDTDTRIEGQSNRPVETEARPTQRPAHEPAPAASANAQSTSEQPQLTGFAAASPTAQQHMSNVAIAQLTAIPAANMAVPVNGLAVEIAANLQIGRSRFEIRLDPPELGRIDVRLDVDRQGQVTSHLIVEKPSTLDLLRRDAQQLERALQDAGLKTSDNGLQFSLRDQQQQSGRNDDNGRNAQRLIVADEETIAAETTARSYGRMIGQRGGIDIRV